MNSFLAHPPQRSHPPVESFVGKKAEGQHRLVDVTPGILDETFCRNHSVIRSKKVGGVKVCPVGGADRRFRHDEPEHGLQVENAMASGRHGAQATGLAGHRPSRGVSGCGKKEARAHRGTLNGGRLS